MRNALGCAWEEHDLVYSNRHGKFINLETMKTWFKRLPKDAGLPSLKEKRMDELSNLFTHDKEEDDRKGNKEKLGGIE